MGGVARFRWAGGLAVVTVAALLVSGCGSSEQAVKPGRTTTTTAATTTRPATTAPPSTTGPVTTTAPPVQAGYVPMYPFADATEVAAWQQAYREAHAAQYLDSGTTAYAFAHFLGYTGIDRVTGGTEDAKGAHVSVGYQIPRALAPPPRRSCT